MTYPTPTFLFGARHKRNPDSPKPFTVRELNARTAGETYLALALIYRSRGNTMNALACCLEGLAHTTGISRPLAVRDQLDDLHQVLDPTGELTRFIRNETSRLDWPSVTVTVRAPTAVRSHTHLERLVSIHQLIAYPSSYWSFNRTYADALRCVTQSRSVHELYVVRCTAPDRPTPINVDHFYCAVVATSISEAGPYYLTDNCAVVRNDGASAGCHHLQETQ